jgi:hypothetical protein
MRIVTVARKPLSEGNVASNVLKHGTGAINIDGSRLATSENLNGGAYSEGGRASLPGDQRTGAAAGMFVEGGGRLPGAFVPPTGRWPANLVLQHLPGCTHAGTTTVASNGHFPASRGRGSDVSGPSGHKGQEGLVERTTKGEVVAQWECEPGCPVAELDGHTSSLHKAGNTVPLNTSNTRDKYGSYDGAAWSRPLYGDSGGASRFFKQVK